MNIEEIENIIDEYYSNDMSNRGVLESKLSDLCSNMKLYDFMVDYKCGMVHYKRYKGGEIMSYEVKRAKRCKKLNDILS